MSKKTTATTKKTTETTKTTAKTAKDKKLNVKRLTVDDVTGDVRGGFYASDSNCQAKSDC